MRESVSKLRAAVFQATPPLCTSCNSFSPCCSRSSDHSLTRSLGLYFLRTEWKEGRPLKKKKKNTTKSKQLQHTNQLLLTPLRKIKQKSTDLYPKPYTLQNVPESALFTIGCTV